MQRDRLWDANETANRLGVQPWRVRDLARQNLLPSVRLGRQVRFDPQKVEEWIDAGGQALPGGWRREPFEGQP